MVINLTSLAGKLAKLDVHFMGQSTRVHYDPLKITTEWVEKSQASDEAFAEAFIAVIKSWDITRSGKKVPLTANGIKTVPLPLLRAVYNAIMVGETAEAEEQGKASSDG